MSAAPQSGGEDDRSHLALDFEDAERVYALERRNEDTPDRVFDRKWAAITLDRALQRLRVECQQAGKAAEADALLPYLTDTGSCRPIEPSPPASS